VCPLTLISLEHGCVSLATLGTEACDAVGGALRPKWREWPSQAIRRALPDRVGFCMLQAALALLPSSAQRGAASGDKTQTTYAFCFRRVDRHSDKPPGTYKLVLNEGLDHSCRRATMGSTRMARRAGT
jgi:hypothetical protein